MHARKQRLVDLFHARLGVAWTGNGEWLRSLCREHAVHQHERYASHVITMDVGDDHRIDRGVVDPQLVQGDQTGGPEIDGKSDARRVDQNAGLEPAADTKRSTGPDEGDLYRHSAAILTLHSVIFAICHPGPEKFPASHANSAQYLKKFPTGRAKSRNGPPWRCSPKGKTTRTARGGTRPPTSTDPR